MAAAVGVAVRLGVARAVDDDVAALVLGAVLSAVTLSAAAFSAG
ncbi:hypothetical protein ACIP9X_00150 [Arthrobacter sp. NPDC093125]